jgi:hypothetical protein
MNAAVDQIASALPPGRYTTRFTVVFEYAGAIAVHLSIATSGQSSQPGSDDDHGFIGHLCSFFNPL